MGGIILRAALSDERFDFRTSGKLGRLVMLASPNRGSHVATKLAPYFGWVSPSLEQLSDATNSYVNRLPNPLATLGLEFGIVEASKDRVIYPNALKLGGCAQYARIDGHHGLMSWYPQTFRVVESFLQTGQFYPERDHAASNRMVADI
jgi:hypothetical protein